MGCELGLAQEWMNSGEQNVRGTGVGWLVAKALAVKLGGLGNYCSLADFE